MGKIKITSAVILTFIATIHNRGTNGMEVNWKRDSEILRGEKHAMSKIVEILMVDAV